MGMTWASTFLHDATRVDRKGLNLTIGLVAGIVIIAPLLAGEGAGSIAGGVFASLGALNLLMAIAARPPVARFPPLAAAALSNAGALALGTIIGTTGWVEVPLVALGIGIILVSASWAGFDSIGLVTAVMLAVGVGIPGGSGLEALERLVLALLGGFWAILGLAITRPILLRRGYFGAREDPRRPTTPPPPSTPVPMPASRVHVRYAILVAGTTAVGLAISLALGLPRDYWVMLTVLVSLRASIATTFSASFLRILGTIGGAGVALGLTLFIVNPWILGVFLFLFAMALFATRWVNYGIYTLFLTPFVILLLNLVYPGSWQFAFVRVFDTVLGGGLAITVATLWWLRDRVEHTGPPIAGSLLPNPPEGPFTRRGRLRSAQAP